MKIEKKNLCDKGKQMFSSGTVSYARIHVHKLVANQQAIYKWLWLYTMYKLYTLNLLLWPGLVLK